MTEHIESGGESGDDTTDYNTANGYNSSPNTYTLTSTSLTEEFLNRFNRSNGYKDTSTNTILYLGDIVKIRRGIADVEWMIAGFDVEHNQTAADGTVYDNGYGIALIPSNKNNIPSTVWNSSGTTSGGYLNSYANTYSCTLAYLNSSDALGNHIINRNVLLSSSNMPIAAGVSSAYTWTNAYGTLLNETQLTGAVDTVNKYDRGEANYKLPLFNHRSYYMGSQYWLRSLYSKTAAVFVADTTETMNANTTTYSLGFRPLIYIR